MPELKLFEVDESDCVKTWVAATSEEEAKRHLLACYQMTEWEDPEEVTTRELPEERARKMMIVDSTHRLAVDGKVSLWTLFGEAKVPELLASTEY